jgi:hypothetical protein
VEYARPLYDVAVVSAPTARAKHLWNGVGIAALLRSGIHENQIVAVRKTSPRRAGTLADLLAVMQTDLRRIEVALREVAIQASFLDRLTRP